MGQKGFFVWRVFFAHEFLDHGVGTISRKKEMAKRFANLMMKMEINVVPNWTEQYLKLVLPPCAQAKVRKRSSGKEAKGDGACCNFPSFHAQRQTIPSNTVFIKKIGFAGSILNETLWHDWLFLFKICHLVSA